MVRVIISSRSRFDKADGHTRRSQPSGSRSERPDKLVSVATKGHVKSAVYDSSLAACRGQGARVTHPFYSSESSINELGDSFTGSAAVPSVNLALKETACNIDSLPLRWNCDLSPASSLRQTTTRPVSLDASIKPTRRCDRPLRPPRRSEKRQQFDSTDSPLVVASSATPLAISVLDSPPYVDSSDTPLVLWDDPIVQGDLKLLGDHNVQRGTKATDRYKAVDSFSKTFEIPCSEGSTLPNEARLRQTSRSTGVKQKIMQRSRIKVVEQASRRCVRAHCHSIRS